MHVLNQTARTVRLTLGDRRKKHVSAQMPNNAYIFSVNLPSELIPNSFFYVEYPSHQVILSCMFCSFIFLI